MKEKEEIDREFMIKARIDFLKEVDDEMTLVKEEEILLSIGYSAQNLMLNEFINDDIDFAVLHIQNQGEWFYAHDDSSGDFKLYHWDYCNALQINDFLASNITAIAERTQIEPQQLLNNILSDYLSIVSV